MSGHRFSRLLGGGAGIEENNDRGTGATEGCAQNAGFTGQFLQTRKQRAQRSAVRLVDAVFERCGEERMTALGEGSEQEHGVLDVDHGVGSGILLRESTAGFFGGKALLRHGKE